MAKKDLTPYRSKRINPYLQPSKPIGTGTPPRGNLDIPRIDDPLIQIPGGGGTGISKTVLEEPEQRKKSTNPYLKEQGPIALPPATVEPETKTPAPEPGRELQHELRPDVKVEEPPVEPRPVEPERVTTVERSPDFTETGDYIVTLADGSTQRIFRDTEQFGHSVWHRVGDTDNPTGIGSTRAEAVSYLERSILEKVEPTIPEKATEFETVRRQTVDEAMRGEGRRGPVRRWITYDVPEGVKGSTWEEDFWPQSLFDPEVKEGRRLLIMSCCATKTDDPGEIPALKRYAGTLFQTLKSKGIPDDVDVAILSAEHGLIGINYPLSKYDTQMTKATQKELLEEEDFIGLVQGTVNGYEDVFLAGGKLYRDTIKDAMHPYRSPEGKLYRDTVTGTPRDEDFGRSQHSRRLEHITETKGRGIGDQRQQLGEWLQKSYYDPSEEGVVIETPKSLEPPTVETPKSLEPPTVSQAQWNQEFMEEIRAGRPPETEVETKTLEEYELEEREVGFYEGREKRRNELTEGFDDLVSKSLRATRKGNFPEVNVPYTRLPEDIEGTGALMFYRGFPILRRLEWDNDKQKHVVKYALRPPEKSSFRPQWTYEEVDGWIFKHKYEAVNKVDQLWDKEPEAWNDVMKALGYKYADRHVFDRVKKATGGFIDKPLYDRAV